MSRPFRILIFSRTTSYRHASIPAGIQALHRLASSSSLERHPFTADDTEDPSVFCAESLSAYRAIILLQCSGEFLDDNQLDALKGFVRSGGGVVAVHCASFAMQSSEWYGRLIGAVFNHHPEPQTGCIRILDPAHPIMACQRPRGDVNNTHPPELSERSWLDEWYNFKAHPRTASAALNVLLTVDEKSYDGGVHGNDHPIAWCQTFDGGRCFYTSLGHFDEAYENDWFLGQLLGAILWVAGLQV
ncbi:ThuA-like domain-containing protein [Staphylotrichum tortipilum]|uniref:ThuA-like domain-containing protein n=1 Tax=Staphylotrichum tortipilum TaxID=2831512 RepID=A0AAN6MKY9_9PEZI|nr:ThuA-like domain-containing protein [Staphylotrichum longicolle]